MDNGVKQEVIAHYQNGRLADALELLQQSSATDSDDDELLQMLTVINMELGELDNALTSIDRLIENNPDDADNYCTRGVLLEKKNDLDAATAAYQKALTLDPANPNVYFNLGNAYLADGKYDQAKSSYIKALVLQPNDYEALHKLGIAYEKDGDHKAAITYLEKSIGINPNIPEVHSSLAAVLRTIDRLEESLEQCRIALELRPDYIGGHINLGMALALKGKYEDAINAFEWVLNKDQNNVTALANLAETCRITGQHKRAYEYCNKAIELQPDNHVGRLTLGNICYDQGDYDAALDNYNMALEEKGNTNISEEQRVEALRNIGLMLLASGDFKNGWEHYEYRKTKWNQTKWGLDKYPQYPYWSGEPLDQKTILVFSEQGIGDQIMFASCLPELLEKSGFCILYCDPKILPLFKRSFPSAEIRNVETINEFRPDDDIPVPDYKALLGSLPHFFRNKIEDFPRHSGYLAADPERISFWKGKLAGLGKGVKIGISWKGGTPRTNQVLRSTSLAEWLPVLQLENAGFVSLQYTACEADLRDLQETHGITLHHWQEAIDDYDETAALVSALDLVISVQTSVIHLAGALGKPVWVAVPAAPEWRYGLKGETMPWYPSARLFRQQTLGEWRPVFERIAEEVRRSFIA